MMDDKAKCVKILETKLASLQRNIKMLKTESEALVATQRGNKRFKKLKDLESNLQAQDYILAVFKKFIPDPATYKQILKRTSGSSSQSLGYKSKEELQIELSELTQQLDGFKNELIKVQGLNKSRHEIAVDNNSFNFKKHKEAPSVISIQIGEENFDSKTGDVHFGEQKPDLVKKIIKNVKTYRNLLNREYEAINIKYDQNKDKILQARSVLVNIQVIKSKIKEAKAQLLEMDKKNSKFEGMLDSYAEGSHMNMETLNNQLKELRKLKAGILVENKALETDLDSHQIEENDQLHRQAKQQLVAESQELKIKMLSLEEKIKALDAFLLESDKDVEKKNKKLEQLQASRDELRQLYDKKRSENEVKQLRELEHLKTEKSKRENLMVKMRLVKNEEYKNLGLLEINKSVYDEKYKELIALKFLTKKPEALIQFAVNADEEINKLVWQKTKLEEQLLKKELYIKHRNELLDISSFNSESDFAIN